MGKAEVVHMVIRTMQFFYLTLMILLTLQVKISMANNVKAYVLRLSKMID